MPDHDDGPDPLIARRRRLKLAAARRRRLVVGGVAAAATVLALAGLVAFAVNARRQAEAAVADAERLAGKQPGRPLVGGPSPTAEGESWTFADLHAYLKGRGVPCRMKPVGGGVAFLFGDPSLDFDAPNHMNLNTHDDGELIEVRRESSAESARQEAGRDPGRSFVWGRFLFVSSPRLLSPVSSALTGRPFAPPR